jgi:hypothetical protein
VPEPTLEFLGQRLKAIQDEQRLQRMRFDVLEQRFSTIDFRLDAIEVRLASVDRSLIEIAGAVDRIIERLER